MAQRGIYLLAVVLAAFISVGHARAPQKIIKGEIAQIAEFPYQVYLDILNGGVCGGTIIDAMHILTAAHCIRPYGSLLANKDIVVITGTNNRHYRPSENVFQVVEATHHPNFNESGYGNDDIAILKLNRPISFNHYQQPAELPKKDTHGYTWVTSSGWGLTKRNGTYSTYLHKLKQIVLSQKICQNWMHATKYDTSQICVWAPEGGDMCSGDSGGPLSSNGVVVGIASQASCGQEYPAIYTRVYKYLAWIKEIMRSRQSSIWAT